MTVQTITGALAELEARAGASDQDREQWLRERNEGVTATQARDLKLGVLKPFDLAKAKLSGELEPNLYRVPVIGWGKDREPIIAERLRGEGIEPETRVFHHAENSRYLASPDGIGVTFDDELIVSEIKTTNEDMWPGSKAYERKGYEWQMQWVMFVTGAARCRFVVEQRVDGPVIEGERVTFTPGEEKRYWVQRDGEKIAALVEVVDAFLVEMDRLAEEGLPEIDEEIDTHALNYLRGLSAEKEGKSLKETAYAALLAAGVSQESPLARVTYTAPKPGVVTVVPTTDFEKAKRARGGKALFAALQSATDAVRDAQTAWDAHCARFTTETEVQGKGSGARVTVTAGKGMKA